MDAILIAIEKFGTNEAIVTPMPIVAVNSRIPAIANGKITPFDGMPMRQKQVNTAIRAYAPKRIIYGNNLPKVLQIPLSRIQ